MFCWEVDNLFLLGGKAVSTSGRGILQNVHLIMWELEQQNVLGDNRKPYVESLTSRSVLLSKHPTPLMGTTFVMLNLPIQEDS